MNRLIKLEELPHYVGGKLTLDSSHIGTPGFRIRMFTQYPLDIRMPGMEDFLIEMGGGGGGVKRRTCGKWKHMQLDKGIGTILTHAQPSQWRCNCTTDVSHFYISPNFLVQVANETFDCGISAIILHDVLGIEDPVLNWLNEQFIHEVSSGSPGGRLYFDALALQASIHLLRNYATIRFKPPRPHGRFSLAQTRLLEDYIEHNIERNITLDELAAACNCTPAQFARKFRVHYQISPHVFVLQRRVEKARQLLRKHSLPLKEVALDCGFSDQSHLTRIFHRFVRCTPGEYRRVMDGV